MRQHPANRGQVACLLIFFTFHDYMGNDTEVYLFNADKYFTTKYERTIKILFVFFQFLNCNDKIFPSYFFVSILFPGLTQSAKLNGVMVL